MTDSDTEATDESPTATSNASCPVDRAATTESSLSDRWAAEVWSNGQYQRIAPKYLSMVAHLVARADVSAGDDVLDVGCGTGTVALTAARRDAPVTGVDIAPTMVERARANAEVAGIDRVSFREGDVTSLPFDANAFDVTLSNLGHMYGDPPEAATVELLRVTRPGGRIGFTSWTPTSLYPAMAGVAMAVLPQEALPAFSAPPFLWGDRGTVRERLGDAVGDLEFETGTVRYPALSPAHFWEETASNSGLFLEVLDGVDADTRAELRARSIEAIEPSFDDRSNAVELEYLLTTASVTAGE